MKKEVILKAAEILKEIETLERVLESFSSVASLVFRNTKEYWIMAVSLSSKGFQSAWLQDNPVISPILDAVLQETGERCLSLFKLKLQAEKNRLAASLESFNEEEFYRSELFNKVQETGK